MTGKGGDGDPGPQELDGVTEMFPDMAEFETFTIMEFVFAPVTIENPAGSDQEYDIALITGETE